MEVKVQVMKVIEMRLIIDISEGRHHSSHSVSQKEGASRQDFCQFCILEVMTVQ